jgi:hypothetical protein
VPTPIRTTLCLLAAGGFTALSLAPARALTVNATFDSSITGSAYSVTIENAITSALGFYSAFTDPITASIYFQLAPANSGYLGASQTSYYSATYASYTAALLQDASTYNNSVQLSGYNSLGTGNTAQAIRGTSADFRALGDSGALGTLTSSGAPGGTFDGVVYLNASYLTGFGGGGSYTPNATIQHEVDEVLGIGGSGSVLNMMQQNSQTSPPTLNGLTTIGALDLFRYSAAGTASLSTSSTATSYFSVNGGLSSVVGFNQCSQGDYADWASAGNPCGTTVSGTSGLVQLAFTPANSAATLGLASPETTALQAIGYDILVPEPAALGLFGIGLAGLGASRRRRGLTAEIRSQAASGS